MHTASVMVGSCFSRPKPPFAPELRVRSSRIYGSKLQLHLAATFRSREPDRRAQFLQEPFLMAHLHLDLTKEAIRSCQRFEDVTLQCGSSFRRRENPIVNDCVLRVPCYGTYSVLVPNL